MNKNSDSRFPRRPFIPLMVAAAIALCGLVVMSLWNALMPDIFKLPAINFWQALGLFALSRLLLGGFSGPGGSARRRRKEALTHRMRERWEHMTPEQREKFRKSLRRRWDFDFEEELPKEPEG